MVGHFDDLIQKAIFQYSPAIPCKQRDALPLHKDGVCLCLVFWTTLHAAIRTRSVRTTFHAPSGIHTV